jgi:hypothetical protein
MKILFILIFFLVIYLFLSYNITSPVIIFLDKNELYNILYNHNMYYNTFTSTDMKVRNIISIDNYKERIRDSVSDFNNNEKNMISNAVITANIKLKKINLPWFNGIVAANLPWKFGIVSDDKYEEGFPHTVIDTIILSRKYIRFTNPMMLLVSTLIHEKVHIYQKKYPEEYRKYLKDNNFIAVQNNNDNIRANPDTFYDPTIYIKNNKIYKMEYKTSPNSIGDTIQRNQYYEHPLETMAIEISNIAMK